jgi:hypothetical protein
VAYLITWVSIQGHHLHGSICLHEHNTNASIVRASQTPLIWYLWREGLLPYSPTWELQPCNHLDQDDGFTTLFTDTFLPLCTFVGENFSFLVFQKGHPVIFLPLVIHSN